MISIKASCFQLTRICDSQSNKMYPFSLRSEDINTYLYSLGNDSLILHYVYVNVKMGTDEKEENRERGEETEKKD